MFKVVIYYKDGSKLVKRFKFLLPAIKFLYAHQRDGKILKAHVIDLDSGRIIDRYVVYNYKKHCYENRWNVCIEHGFDEYV